MALWILEVFAVLVLLSILCIRGKLKQRINFLYLVSKIPGPTIWDLVTVHAKRFMGKPLHHTYEQCKFYGYKPWGLFSISLEYIVFVSNADDVREIYQNKNTATKMDFFYRGVEDYAGYGLIANRGGEMYRFHRKLITPAFHKTKLELNIDIISVGAHNMVEKMKEIADGQSVDISRIIDLEMGASTIKFLSSGRVKVPDQEEFSDTVVQVCKLIQLRSTNPVEHWIRLHLRKKYREIENKARFKISEFRTRTKTARKEALVDMKSRLDQEPRDVFEFMVNNHSKTRCLNEDEVFDEFFNVTLGALETTRAAVKIAILLLALHPEEQQKVAEELDNIFGKSEERATPSDLDKMQYLGMVIKETLRLFPAVPLFGRKVLGEINVNGTIIPKGGNVMVNLMALHRNPKYFKDPTMFYPERFLPELSKNWHPYCYVPFSSGVRTCVGKTHGIMVMKVVLSTILRRYEVLSCEGMSSVSDIEFTIHIGIDARCKVKLVSRKKYFL